MRVRGVHLSDGSNYTCRFHNLTVLASYEALGGGAVTCASLSAAGTLILMLTLARTLTLTLLQPGF